MPTIKVMIVDDHPLVRQGLKLILSFREELEIIGEAQHGDEVIERVRIWQPDVILMDISLPGKNGIELTAELRNLMPQVKVLILTADAEQYHIQKIIKAGALGYLLKDVEPDILAEAIVTVARGEAYIQPCLLVRLLAEFRQLSIEDPDVLPPEEYGLTQRELEIIGYIACGQTNKEIAEKLFISEKTVKNHVSSILRKMALDDRTQVAIYAYKKGLIAR